MERIPGIRLNWLPKIIQKVEENMNKRELTELLEKMDDMEAVEIRKIGKGYEISKFIHPVVEKSFVSQGSFRSTSLVSVMTNKFQHYREFGKKPVEENEIEREFIIALFEQLILSNPNSVKYSTEKVNFLKYDVKEIDGYKGYYNKDNRLSFVISDGIDYWTSNKG